MPFITNRIRKMTVAYFFIFINSKPINLPLMRSSKLNVFIVDDDSSTVTLVRNHLHKRFGRGLNISTYEDGESCLENMDEHTHVIILDYYLNGKNGLDILQKIKTKNSTTEVIMLSGNEDLVAAIESLKRGARDYVIKDSESIKRISTLVNRMSESFRAAREPRYPGYRTFLLLTLTTMAIILTVIFKFYY